jgi:hypothetical protein
MSQGIQERPSGRVGERQLLLALRLQSSLGTWSADRVPRKHSDPVMFNVGHRCYPRRTGPPAGLKTTTYPSNVSWERAQFPSYARRHCWNADSRDSNSHRIWPIAWGPRTIHRRAAVGPESLITLAAVSSLFGEYASSVRRARTGGAWRCGSHVDPMPARCRAVHSRVCVYVFFLFALSCGFRVCYSVLTHHESVAMLAPASE